MALPGPTLESPYSYAFRSRGRSHPFVLGCDHFSHQNHRVLVNRNLNRHRLLFQFQRGNVVSHFLIPGFMIISPVQRNRFLLWPPLEFGLFPSLTVGVLGWALSREMGRAELFLSSQCVASLSLLEKLKLALPRSQLTPGKRCAGVSNASKKENLIIIVSSQ